MSTPLTLYGCLTTSATLPSANTFIANVTGGSISSTTTRIGTATGYGEVYSQGSTAAWPASGGLNAPDGGGILFDVTTLEGQTILAGNWTPTLRLHVSSGSIVADIYLRAYVFDGLNYRQIGGNMLLSGQTITSSFTNFVFAGTSLPAQALHVGEKVYIQVNLNITSNSTGSGTAVVNFGQSNSTTKGTTNFQIVTPGYQTSTSSSGSRSAPLRIRVVSPTLATRSLALRTKVTTKAVPTVGLRLSVRTTPMSIMIAGNLVAFDEGTFKLSPKLDERWRCQFTVLDYAGNLSFSYGMAVTITDDSLGTLFTGFVVDDQVDPQTGYPSGLLLHQIDCIDNRHRADKRTSNRLYSTPTYAGKIMVDMVDDTLAAEGVIAPHVTAVTATTADWAAGTLSGTVATSNLGDGDLELASSASIGASYLAQSDWMGGGTFSAVQANSDGSLALSGIARLWNDGVFSGQTLYGITSPGESKSITQGVASGRYYLTCPAADESHVRMDFAGTWKNGTIEVDMNLAKDGLVYSLEYRTTNWNNNNETYAYAVELTTTSIKLKRGSNGGMANAATTLGTKTFSTKLGTGWYRVRVAVSGSSHTISHNGKQDLSVSDSAYTAAGYIGLRNRNPSSCAAKDLFDNFGVLAALSGTWTSAAVDLSGVSSVVSSQISWDASASTGGTVAVAASTDGGATYQPCSNGGLLPGLAPGASGSGKSLVIKVTLATTSTVLLPKLRTLVWSVAGGFASQGTRSTAPVPSSDTFVRANQTGWGTTAAGQNWVQDVGGGTPSIVSNTGQIATSGVDTTMKLGGGTHADSSTVVNVQFALSTDYAYVYARYGNGASAYYRVLFGTNVMQINKWNGGVYTTLASTTPTIAASTHYSVRFQVVGTALSARYWVVGTTEPGTWTLTATDSAVTSGLVALGASGSGAGGSLVQFDNLTVAFYQNAGLDLSPVGRAGASFISWNATVPDACTLEMDISFDQVNWTDISDQNGQPIPGIFTQPDPTVDGFSSDTRGNYTAASAITPAIFTTDATNSRLIASGGNTAFYLNNTLQNADVDLLCDLDWADTGGLVWAYSSPEAYYLCTITDKQASGGAMLTLSKGQASSTRLHVDNGIIVNAVGAPIRLRGLNTAGLEFGDGVSDITQARINALASAFSMNLWRLAINVSWWNNNALMPDGVTHYQTWIQTVIGWMKAAGCYVEIDPTTWITLPPSSSGAFCSTNGLNPPQTSIGTDTFTRANQSGWGTASDLSTWSTITGSPTLSIASNEGVMTATGGNDVYMKLGSGSGSDQTGAVRFAMTKTTQPYAGVMLRFTNSSNWYRFYSDTSSLLIDKLVGGSYASLGSVSKPLVSGTFYWLRAYVVGTTLYTRLWQDGTTEPNLWDIQVTDTSLASGGVGLFGKTNTGDTVKFDNFATGVPVTSCITHQDTLNFPPWTQAQMLTATHTFFTSFIGIYGSDPAILYNALNEPIIEPNFFTDVIAANNDIINFIQTLAPSALIFISDGNMRNYVLNGDPDHYTQSNLVWDFHLYDDLVSPWTWQNKLIDFQSTFTYAQAHNHAVTIGEWSANTTNDPGGFGAAIANLAITQGIATSYYNEGNVLLTDNTTLTTEGLIVAATFQTIAAPFPSVSVPVDFVRGTHHRLRVTREAGTMTVFFDGAQKISATDLAPLPAGLMGLYQSGNQSRYSQLWLQPLGDDLTGVTLYTQQILTTSDSSVTPQVEDLTICVFSPSIDLGTLIPAVDYRSTFIDKDYDDLAKQSNYSWFIDPGVLLHFHHRSAYPAPWIVQSNTLALASDLVVDTNLLLEQASDLYRNRQVLKGVINTGIFQDSFAGDGKRTSFTLSYPIAPGTVPVITLGGNKQKAGKKGTTGSQWYYAEGDATIGEDSSGTTLISTDTLIVSYTGTFSDTITLNNADAQTALKKREGSTGIVEAVEDVSQKNMTYAAGLTYAQQLLDRYCVLDMNNLPTGRTYTFTTYRDGLKVGQIIPVFVPEQGMTDVQMLIVAIDITIQSQTGRTVLYNYLVTISELPVTSSWAKLFASGLFD